MCTIIPPYILSSLSSLPLIPLRIIASKGRLKKMEFSMPGSQGPVLFLFNPNSRNIRRTQDQSVNSSLSVVVQEIKNRTLYLHRFSRGGPRKFESTFFQKAKLRFSMILADFHQNYRIFTKFSGVVEF